MSLWRILISWKFYHYGIYMTKYKIIIALLSVFAAVLLGLGIFMFIRYGNTIQKNIDYEKTIKEGKEAEAALKNEKILLSEELAGYELQIDELDSELESMSEAANGYIVEAEGYSERAQELETQINELNSEVESLNSQITDLNSQVAYLSDSNYGIKANGRLKVIGTKLCNEKGEPVQLKGMSTHGISWFPRYTNAAALQTLKDYGANVIRLAVYSEQNDSYTYAKEENLNYLYNAVENALSINMYAIVDWHVLQEETPLTYKAQAKEFFQEVSSHYGNEPGIIYEICNEPNGATTWDEIVSYANEIIPVIRQNAPDAIIIVGTPDFSFDVQDVLNNPLNYSNIMYTFHNYVDVTYTSTEDMNWMQKKLQLDIPIFVTEWGITDNGTNSALYEDRAMKFVDFMEQNNISWCMWSISNKDEIYSMLKTSCNKYSGWTEADLTFSGKIAVMALGAGAD